jgi:hypothetical protein
MFLITSWLNCINPPITSNAPLEFRGYRIFFQGEPADPFGPIDSGYLFVKGVVISGFLVPSTDAYKQGKAVINHIGLINNIGVSVHLDWLFPSLESRHVLCLDMGICDPFKGHHLIILEEVAGVADSYVRIGMAYLREKRRSRIEVREWLKSGTIREIKLY